MRASAVTGLGILWAPSLLLAVVCIFLWEVSIGKHLVRREFRRKTDADLEQEVFESLGGCLSVLGNDTPEVKEYLSIVERRDVLTLAQRWPELQRAMHGREIEQGSSGGRPLILDFNVYYDEALDELARRARDKALKSTRSPAN